MALSSIYGVGYPLQRGVRVHHTGRQNAMREGFLDSLLKESIHSNRLAQWKRLSLMEGSSCCVCFFIYCHTLADSSARRSLAALP